MPWEPWPQRHPGTLLSPALPENQGQAGLCGQGLGLEAKVAPGVGRACGRGGRPRLSTLVFSLLSPLLWPQVVMKVVQLLPDGHCVKKEVDAALDTVSETMTPMHYHLREIIICTYRQVSPTPSPGVHPACGCCGCV